MAAQSLFLPADAFWQRGGTVTTTAGTTDSDYTDDWLVDDRANRPAKATNGTATWSIAAASGSISGIAVCNHNIEAARTITIGGGITATGSGPTARKNGIPHNAWIPISPTATGVTGFTVGVASNPSALTIGEVVSGLMQTFPGGGLLANGLGGGHRRMGNGASSVGVPAYDSAEAARVWRSSVLATRSELDTVMGWFEAQRNESRFSLFIPSDLENDAWLVYLDEPDWTYEGSRYRVTLNMREIPRVRW